MVDVVRLGFSEQALHPGVDPSFGTGPGPVEYVQAWDVQRRVHADVASFARDNTVLLLEHEPVYTAGRQTADWERPTTGAPVVDVDRGGRITWHGPQQLVGYPILRLVRPIDVVHMVRRLEETIMAVCAEVGLRTVQVEGRSGVWVPADDRGPERKVCAIGLRVSRTVTMHGFALNCSNDLSAADPIVPCGIQDAGVTSLSAELGRTVAVSDVLDIAERHLVPLAEELSVPLPAPAGDDGRITVAR
jgi:lipoyl(octanoyl) transferase